MFGYLRIFIRIWISSLSDNICSGSLILWFRFLFEFFGSGSETDSNVKCSSLLSWKTVVNHASVPNELKEIFWEELNYLITIFYISCILKKDMPCEYLKGVCFLSALTLKRKHTSQL